MRQASILLLVFVICTSSCAQSNQASVISADELLEMQADGVPVVDVRTLEEVSQGKIPGALNVTLSESFAQSMKNFDKSKPIILYCRSGRRSTSAADQLIEAGYTSVYNYKGSFNEWTTQNRPTE